MDRQQYLTMATRRMADRSWSSKHKVGPKPPVHKPPYVSDNFQIGPDGAFERIVDRDMLYKLYISWVNQVADDLEWKTQFGPREIINAIANIIESNPDIIQSK